jgi:exopolysaccharide biosynthesis protein
MAGVERDGDLLLVAVDGGGSTTMVIRGTVVTRPSDATGERPIGDAILVAP